MLIQLGKFLGLIDKKEKEEPKKIDRYVQTGVKDGASNALDFQYYSIKDIIKRNRSKNEDEKDKKDKVFDKNIQEEL